MGMTDTLTRRAFFTALAASAIAAGVPLPVGMPTRRYDLSGASLHLIDNKAQWFWIIETDVGERLFKTRKPPIRQNLDQKIRHVLGLDKDEQQIATTIENDVKRGAYSLEEGVGSTEILKIRLRRV